MFRKQPPPRIAKINDKNRKPDEKIITHSFGPLFEILSRKPSSCESEQAGLVNQRVSPSNEVLSSASSLTPSKEDDVYKALQEIEDGWYYVNKRGSTSGPIDVNELKKLYMKGEVRDGHYLWNALKAPNWVPLKTIPDLFAYLSGGEKQIIEKPTLLESKGHSALNVMQSQSQLQSQSSKLIVHKNHKTSPFLLTEMKGGNACAKGYPKDIFLDRVDESYLCILCSAVAKNAVEITCEQHNFLLCCEQCLLDFFNAKCDGRQLCPAVHTNDIAYHAVHTIRQMIQQYTVRCANYSVCAWTGSLCMYNKEHILHCGHDVIVNEHSKSNVRIKSKHKTQWLQMPQTTSFNAHVGANSHSIKEILPSSSSWPRSSSPSLSLLDAANKKLPISIKRRHTHSSNVTVDANAKTISLDLLSTPMSCSKSDPMKEIIDKMEFFDNVDDNGDDRDKSSPLPSQDVCEAKRSVSQICKTSNVAQVPGATINCPFSKCGCDYCGDESSLRLHLQSEVIRHSEIQFAWTETMMTTPSSIYVTGFATDNHYHNDNDNDNNNNNNNNNDNEKKDIWQLNGIYQREEFVLCGHAVYRKRYNEDYVIRWHPDLKWVFVKAQIHNKNKSKLLDLDDDTSSCRSSSINGIIVHDFLSSQMSMAKSVIRNLLSLPNVVLFVLRAILEILAKHEGITDNKDVTLLGFDDFNLFRKLCLIEAPNIIKVGGRKGINSQVNGLFCKQTTLHCGRVWYRKIERQDEDDVSENVETPMGEANRKKVSKNEWVIRYHPQSQQWLFDKRGLRTDDVANILGKGNVMSPLEINNWEVHDGCTFARDEKIIVKSFVSRHKNKPFV
ncbi:hypothetical protein RFI_08624 [Reticulomyxa filosa]|uniref:GYF domain-containing protein n=1 Tax=Reticulomyxa filosa TaxID=46433 RepID=X6NQD9_RETFI|nr:hypothetical protein RFI_08624 [Reticulomyxa filosa]|eukprot:ETO28505.1 hypothetical protein RFI_08624 [Reticulomyxa filosa]